MKNLAIAILVFCTFICAVYPAFHCYQCEGKLDLDYTTDQCEHEQILVDCPANDTCFKSHGITTYDTEQETRGCLTKALCENFLQVCKNGTDELKKAASVKECEGVCCVSDGDTPCNSGFTVPIDMMMIMFAVLCSLKIF